jgi:hypothetical protein
MSRPGSGEVLAFLQAGITVATAIRVVSRELRDEQVAS